MARVDIGIVHTLLAHAARLLSIRRLPLSLRRNFQARSHLAMDDRPETGRLKELKCKCKASNLTLNASLTIWYASNLNDQILFVFVHSRVPPFDAGLRISTG